jgi:hypothetical protein
MARAKPNRVSCVLICRLFRVQILTENFPAFTGPKSWAQVTTYPKILRREASLVEAEAVQPTSSKI